MNFKLAMFFLIIIQSLSSGASESLKKELKALDLKPKDTAAIFWGDEGVQKINWRENVLMKPASLTKIATAAFAMDNLDLDFRWKSELKSAAPIKQKKLEGDLCFYGGGNPSFLTEQLWVLTNHFNRTGIKTVTGDLLVDESYLDSEYFDDKRMKKRVLRSYDSPVSGASFNWNSVNIYVRPGSSVGQKAVVYMDPPNEYIQVVNKVKTTSSGKHYVDITRKEEAGVEIFTLNGRIPVSSEEKVFYRPIKRPALWTGHNIKAVLARLGIEIKGSVKKDSCPSGARTYAAVESKDISLVVRDLMKFSNNFIAEILAKTIVKEKKYVSGNMDQALEMMDAYLGSVGSKGHEVYSVSGLSYQNRMTAASIAGLLQKQEKNFGVYAEFLSSLPIGGVDGTLKSRFKSEAIKSKIRAKTGLLNKVVGLAGYGQTKSKKAFGFVLIYNSSNSKESWKVRRSFDRLVAQYAERN